MRKRMIRALVALLAVASIAPPVAMADDEAPPPPTISRSSWG